MNYERIYAEFIADRRQKEAGLTGYTERHHILPRSLGGGNDAANLIRLTAKDHLFAHMLLAKIHGKGMWFALSLMVSKKRNKERIFTTPKIRLAYMMLRENFSATIKNLFANNDFCNKHKARTSEGTKKAFTDPNIKRKHLKAMRIASQKRIKPKQLDAHVKSYRKELNKIQTSINASNRMKFFYDAGMQLGTRLYNPAKDENRKESMSASQRRRFFYETEEQKKARVDAMHTDNAKARRKETLKKSDKWAAFQIKNKQPKPNQSGANHWRVKRKASLEAMKSAA